MNLYCEKCGIKLNSYRKVTKDKQIVDLVKPHECTGTINIDSLKLDTPIPDVGDSVLPKKQTKDIIKDMRSQLFPSQSV